MIILSSGHYTIGNPIFAISAVIVGIAIMVYLLGYEALLELNKAKTWLVLLSMGIVLTICIVGIVNTAKVKYKIYLEDITLKELETEYDIIDIDGLILECTKKDK